MPVSSVSAKVKYASPDGSRTWEYLAIATSALSGFCSGANIGWLSPTIAKLMEPDSPVRFTPEDVSTMVAAGGVGQLCGPLVANMIVDRLGRRKSMLISVLPTVLSSAMIIMARHVWTIHISRLLAGFSLGMLLCVSPMYTGEISSVENRGIAGSIVGVMVNLGILAAYAICPYLSIATVAGILMMISITFEVSFWFMPETPHYLSMVGRLEDATSTLEQLRGKMDVKEELDTIMESMPHDHNNHKPRKPKLGSILDVFANRVNRRTFIIAFSFLIIQSLGLFLTIITYGELLFRDAGSAIPSNLATLSIGVTQVLAAILAGVLVDRLGRKPLILASGLVAGLANFVMGFYLFAKEYMDCDVHPYAVVFLIAVLVQVFAFNCGLLSTHMVIMSEIFATEVKGISTCIIFVCGGIFLAVTGKLYITLAITLGLGHSLPFLAGAAVVWGFTGLIFKITPETKGKTFSQIQQELRRYVDT